MYLSFSFGVTRQARYFPPSSDDLDDSITLLEDAHTSLKKSGVALAKLAEDVSRFPAIGPDKGKREAVVQFQRALQNYTAAVSAVSDLRGEVSNLQESLMRAFHSPAGQRGEPSYMDMTAGAPGYTYKRLPARAT